MAERSTGSWQRHRAACCGSIASRPFAKIMERRVSRILLLLRISINRRYAHFHDAFTACSYSHRHSWISRLLLPFSLPLLPSAAAIFPRLCFFLSFSFLCLFRICDSIYFYARIVASRDIGDTRRSFGFTWRSTYYYSCFIFSTPTLLLLRLVSFIGLLFSLSLRLWRAMIIAFFFLLLAVFSPFPLRSSHASVPIYYPSSFIAWVRNHTLVCTFKGVGSKADCWFVSLPCKSLLSYDIPCHIWLLSCFFYSFSFRRVCFCRFLSTCVRSDTRRGKAKKTKERNRGTAIHGTLWKEYASPKTKERTFLLFPPFFERRFIIIISHTQERKKDLLQEIKTHNELRQCLFFWIYMRKKGRKNQDKTTLHWLDYR